METSLTVAEGGHLEVRVRGGALSYALWETEGVATEPGERF